MDRRIGETNFCCIPFYTCVDKKHFNEIEGDQKVFMKFGLFGG